METSKEKICPLSMSGEVFSVCREAECAWWCGFAQDCAVPLLAGMFNDSDISHIKWNATGGFGNE